MRRRSFERVLDVGSGCSLQQCGAHAVLSLYLSTVDQGSVCYPENSLLG